MHINFKSINNRIYNYNVNSDDNIISIIPKLYSDAKIDKNTNNIKIIYKGQVLNLNNKFSDFNDESPTVIFITSKIKENNNINSIELIQETNKNANQTKPNLEHLNNLPILNTNNPNKNILLDGIDELRSTVIAVLVFIKTNPQLAELFINNFPALINVLSSSEIKPLFEKLISDNQDASSNYLDDLTESLSNNFEQSQNSQNKLNEQDIENINILVNLGFNEDVVIHTYLVCDKNINMTASILMDN